MKALFLTDVHTSDDALGWVRSDGGDYEAVIVGGDLAKGRDQAFTTRFLAAALQANPAVYYVPGNADRPDTPVPEGVTKLHGRTARVGKYLLGGLGGSNHTPFDTPFELEDEEAWKVLSSLGKVDVLVSHCPPARTKCDKSRGGHMGSDPVRRYVEEKMPALVLSGHVHESRAIDNLGGTTLVNPGPLMEGKFAVVDLGSILSVELKEGAFGSRA